MANNIAAPSVLFKVTLSRRLLLMRRAVISPVRLKVKILHCVMVLIGALSVFLGLEESVWSGDIRARLRPDFVESSLKAFSLGAENIRTREN